MRAGQIPFNPLRRRNRGRHKQSQKRECEEPELQSQRLWTPKLLVLGLDRMIGRNE